MFHKKQKWKKICFFLIYFFFPLCPLFARDSEIDSLLRELSAAKEDTNKANLLYPLSEICDENDIIKYASELLDLSEKLGFKEGIAGALNNLGYAYHLSAPDKALRYYFQALVIREEMQDTESIAYCLTILAQFTGIKKMEVLARLRRG